MSAEATSVLPTVTVVVATHNRPASLAKLVDALHALAYPRALLEVVIVDDGSTPPAVLQRNELGIRLLRQPNAGPASARNAGLRAASGELIALSDDDCCPHPDWLTQLAEHYRADRNALLGGYTRNVLTDDACSVASQLLVDYLYEYMGRHSAENYFFTTSNVAASRSGLLALGGFDESFPLPAAEDRDLCDRWKAGGPLVYVPRAVVDHAHGMSLRAYLRQQFRYGRGACVLHARRSARGESSRVEGLGFYLGLFASPFRRQPLVRAVRTAALLLCAQVANTLGYFYEARAGRR